MVPLLSVRLLRFCEMAALRVSQGVFEQWDAPPGVWAREATPEEVDLLREALDAHRRALDREAELAMDLVVLVALAFGAGGVLLGWLLRMAVKG